jgi:hypothetical protein
MPSFLVLKPEYPHESASNSLFSVKKGEILECPQGYEPSNSFQVCDSRATAEQYLSLISSQSKAESGLPHKAEEQTGKLLPTPTYPLFRKVASIGDDEPSYQLFSRDIHRFLSQTEAEIIADIHERKHFTRKGIIDVLEAIVKGEEKEGEEMKGDVQSGESKEELHV